MKWSAGVHPFLQVVGRVGNAQPRVQGRTEGSCCDGSHSLVRAAQTDIIIDGGCESGGKRLGWTRVADVDPEPDQEFTDGRPVFSTIILFLRQANSRQEAETPVHQ